MGYKQSGNQMVVEVVKTPVDAEKLFFQSDMDTLQKTMQTLDAGAVMLWLYLAKNKNGYKFALSSKDASENWGIGMSQYKTAKRKLIDAGFLVCVDEDKREYIFYDDGSGLARNKPTLIENEELVQNEPTTYNEMNQVVSTNCTKGLVQNIPTNNIYNINNINNISDSSQEESEYSDAVAAALRMNGLLQKEGNMEAINLYLYCKGTDKTYMRYPYWNGYFEDEFKALVQCLDLNKPAILYALQHNEIKNKTIADLYAKAITGENVNTLLKEYKAHRKFAPVNILSDLYRQKKQQREDHFKMIQSEIIEFPIEEVENYIQVTKGF